MEEREEIVVSEASRPQSIDQLIQEPPPPPSLAPEGGALEVEIGAPEMMGDCSGLSSMPISIAPPLEAEQGPVFDRVGDEALEIHSLELIEETQALPESRASIGAFEMGPADGSSVIPMSTADSEEAPVLDQPLVPIGDRGGDEAIGVCGSQFGQGEESKAILCGERGGKVVEEGFRAHEMDGSELLGFSAVSQSANKIGVHELMDCSQPAGPPSVISCDSLPREAEEAPVFDQPAVPGPAIDRGGDEASDAYRTRSIEQLSEAEGTISIICEKWDGQASDGRIGVSEMDGLEPLSSSVGSQPGSVELGNEVRASDPAVAQQMDDSKSFGSSVPPHSASEVDEIETATLKSSTAIASDEPSEGKEGGTLQCDEGDNQALPADIGEPEINDPKLQGFPSVPSEEDEEAPALEPSANGGSTTSSSEDNEGEDEVQMDVEVSEPVMDAAPRGRTLRRGRSASLQENRELPERGRVGGRGRGKRGRPFSAQATTVPVKRRKEKEKEKVMDEELCFICFDGGDLVVCDRKGCPKVYHPSCVNRDEAFFRAKGRWNCGWHICSNCQKSAHYMCYTCTFSLCKGCISEAGFVRVRGNKGFCVTCMSTVMLIESNDGTKKMDGIDFDDKTSWMSFFKDYWLDLKRKLSLTSEELTRAKIPWKESNTVSHNESFDDAYNANAVNEASSDSSSGRLKGRISSRKKTKKRSRNIGNEADAVKATESEGASTSEDVSWASKELLELVTYMKNGDKSILSEFDVQALLLEYIKQNNLRDPRKKSNIICDSMLLNLFGKTRVGHFEMLKLLESHILTKEPSPVVTDDNQEGVVDPDPSQMETEGNSDASTKMTSDKRRKTRKRVLEKEPQTNLDDYAAVDVHNINLMYLRRNLMEDLIDNVDTFTEKVAGSFVRIRIFGSVQRQDMYRLVQVIGTGSAAKRYRTGKKTTDFTLEILNLDKTEFITIDLISNQEFTEEECKRLKQSIKCGFISPLTVREVQEKARDMQAVRVNDWLESEKLRVGNLRDRASEQGRRKELRECVEKLQLLNTREERMRRLNEVPEIHADPEMNPEASSEDEGEPNYKIQDNSGYQREYPSSKTGSDGISPRKGVSTPNNNWNSGWDLRPSTSTENQNNQSLTQAAHETSSFEGSKPHANSIGLEVVAANNIPLVVKSETLSAVPSEKTQTPPPTSSSETEKVWHYQDPTGKVQGPFSMTQLRKWNASKFFPADHRIWRTSEGHEGSILLTDALVGKLEKELPQCSSTELVATTGLNCESAPGSEAVNQNEVRVETPQPSQGQNSSGSVAQICGNQGSGTHQNNWSSNRSVGPQACSQGLGRQLPNWSTGRATDPRGNGAVHIRNGSEASASPNQDSIANPAAAANLDRQIRPLESEQSLSGPTPVKPCNSEQPMQLQAPPRRPSRWDTTSDSISGNRQTAQWKASTTPPSACVVTAQPSNSGLGAAVQNPSAQPSNSGLGAAVQNQSAQPSNSGLAHAVAGTPQGSSNMMWGSQVQPPSSVLTRPPQGNNSNMMWGQNPGAVVGTAQGSTNVGWGTSNANVVWGVPAQGNPNLGVGWGTPVQPNPNLNMNMTWGTPAQGNVNQNPGWVAPVQGNAPTWVASVQGNPNPNLGSGLPPSQNVGWGAPVDGTTSSNVIAGQGNATTPGMNPNHSGGVGSSWGGICRFFHETGHCRKGASCNFIHK